MKKSKVFLTLAMVVAISATLITSVSAVTDYKSSSNAYGWVEGTLTHSWYSPYYVIGAYTNGTNGTPYTGLSIVRASNGAQLPGSESHRPSSYWGGGLDYSGISPAVGNLSFFGSHEMRRNVGSQAVYTGLANLPW